MKIVKLTCENFKRLSAVEIVPDGNTVLITGKNGAGKSSVLDAIVSALCGKKYAPEMPIRTGQDHAEVVVETDNYIVKRTFTEKGGGSVTITNADGMMAKSPQKLLDKIVGEIAFEPMAFITMGKTVAGKREQKDTLMKLVGLDFSDIDAELETIKQERSEVKSAKETYEFEAGRLGDFDDELPDKDLDRCELLADMEKAMEHNNLVKANIDKMAVNTQYVGRSEFVMKTLDEKIVTLQTALAEAVENAKKAKAERDSFVKENDILKEGLQDAIDVSDITDQLDAIDKTNELIRAKKQKAEMLAKVEAKANEFAELGKKSKLVEAKKAKRLSEKKMPVDGLGIDESGITYKGLPLMTGVNTAKHIEIAVAISMALNPKLKVIRISGNDLDKDSLAIVSKMAKDQDYQLWVESVSNDENVGIYIEEGEVKAIDGKPTKAE